MTDARDALVDLLRTMFTAERLRDFLRDLPGGPDLTDALPTPSVVGLSRYAEGAADELIARQTDRVVVFEALRRVSDDRQADVTAVEEVWTANPPSRRAPAAAAAFAPTVRPHTQDFVNRDTEIERLTESLASASATALIRGMGGSGRRSWPAWPSDA